MATKDPDTPKDPTLIVIERVFATTPERLFQAWTDPALTSRWLAPGPMTCSLPVYEARKGGRFRIEMRGPGPGGKEMMMAYEGTFEEVVPGKRIVMAWPPATRGKPSPSDPPSIVTITFTPVEGGTLLRLTQGGMPGREGAEHGKAGWESSFDKLEAVL